jgi:DNA mismatch repair protein MSH6
MATKRSSPDKGGMKQGNLFSFFTKKKTADKGSSNLFVSTTASPVINLSLSSTPPAASQASVYASSHASQAVSPASSSASSTTSLHTPPSQTQQELTPSPDAGQVTLKSRLDVYWPDDDEYYRATVTKKRSGSQVYLEYDDGQCEWIDLSTQTYKVVGSENKHKKRRIQIDDDDDDDEEFEFNGELDDGDNAIDRSGGRRHNRGRDIEEEKKEEEGRPLADVESGRSTRRYATSNKNVRVTLHDKPATTIKSPSSSQTITSTPPPTSRLQSFAANASVISTSSVSVSAPLSASSSRLPGYKAANTRQGTSTPPATSSKAVPATVTPSSEVHVPMYVRNELNPGGSHVHNHLKFIRNPKDAQGRTRDHPDYDPRTLQVDYAEYEKYCGKMTAAVQQWWDLKSQYFDTILLFKTGKFYELFHTDADIAVQVCNLLYMKGHVAHVGFPEISYGIKADLLVRAGYKVGRVEQTETPEMLAQRKKKYSGKNAPKVVNREVCSIMTLGTRTFCYLDDDRGITNNDGYTGPMLAIKEVLLEPMECNGKSNNNNIERNAVQPVCEYGVTLIDAVHGTVTIGQFADDVLRSRMDTLLTTFAPSEILLSEDASPILKSLIAKDGHVVSN